MRRLFALAAFAVALLLTPAAHASDYGGYLALYIPPEMDGIYDALLSDEASGTATVTWNDDGIILTVEAVPMLAIVSPCVADAGNLGHGLVNGTFVPTIGFYYTDATTIESAWITGRNGSTGAWTGTYFDATHGASGVGFANVDQCWPNFASFSETLGGAWHAPTGS